MPIPVPPLASQSGLTLAAVKEHLNERTSAHDSELDGFLNAAVDYVTRYLGVLYPASKIETLTPGPGGLLLSYAPVLSITSIAAPLYGLNYTTDALLVSSAGVVSLSSGAAWSRYPVTVTYTAGYDPLPATLRGAILDLVRDNYGGTQQGALGIGVDAAGPPRGFYASRSVRERLDMFGPPVVA